MSSFWEPPVPERLTWPAPLHGCQPQLLFRPVYPARSAGEISVARANGTYRDYMKKLRKEKLLILDEWLL